MRRTLRTSTIRELRRDENCPAAADEGFPEWLERCSRAVFRSGNEMDGAWCSVGALNLDNHSVVFNGEVALMVHDAGSGRQLAQIYAGDLARAHRVTLDDLAKSSWSDRARAWGAHRSLPLL